MKNLLGGTEISGKLLEKLVQEEHCFISDLNRTCDREKIIRYLKEMDLSQFSLEEWTYTLSYIFQKDFPFNSYEEIDDFFNSK